MKSTFMLFIDAIIYTIIFILTIRILEYFKVDFNYAYVIIFTLIIFVLGKMTFKRFVNKRKEEI